MVSVQEALTNLFRTKKWILAIKTTSSNTDFSITGEYVSLWLGLLRLNSLRSFQASNFPRDAAGE